MSTIPQRILDSLQALPAEKQAEVFDFIEFLQQRYSYPKHDQKAIEELCGKYHDLLSSSEEVAKGKQEEIDLEEEKWQHR